MLREDAPPRRRSQRETRPFPIYALSAVSHDMVFRRFTSLTCLTLALASCANAPPSGPTVYAIPESILAASGDPMPNLPSPTAAPNASLSPSEVASVTEVRGILPEGWVITRVTARTIPDGWHSESATGLRIDGQKGPERFSLWILPRDWIGIRKPGSTDARANYWAGILSGEKRTTITISSEATIPEKLRELGLSTPSIVNNGFAEDEKVWEGRFEMAEATAERLIRAHCSDQAAHDEAALSLVELGVPAASVFRRSALVASEGSRSFSITALGYFRGPATVTVIATLLRDPSLPDRLRGYAAFAASGLAAPELGAPLLDALALTKSLDAQRTIVEGLARLRHAAAGPKVLVAMRAANHPDYKARFANALAMLRYRPAEAEIRALAEGPFVPGSGKFTREDEESVRAKARLARIRLMGPWGAPAGDLSLLLVGPKEAKRGNPMQGTVYVEHTSDDVESHSTASSGRFFVEGLGFTRNMDPPNGLSTTDPLVMWRFERDLGEWLKNPGTYKIRYEAGGAVSNTVTVVVK